MTHVASPSRPPSPLDLVSISPETSDVEVLRAYIEAVFQLLGIDQVNKDIFNRFVGQVDRTLGGGTKNGRHYSSAPPIVRRILDAAYRPLGYQNATWLLGALRGKERALGSVSKIIRARISTLLSKKADLS